jgi:hypothetical protein
VPKWREKNEILGFLLGNVLGRSLAYDGCGEVRKET